MSHAKVASGLGSVAFTTPVPFSEDGETILLDAYQENLTFIDEAGASLYVPCGNTGEYYSLTNQERIAVVAATVDAVSNDSTVVAGAAGSVKEVLELAEAYEDAGAAGLMVMHPDHTYIHNEGLERYYRNIASATDLGVVIYKRSHEIPDSVVGAVADHENIAGIKYAVNDVNSFAKLTAMVPETVACVNGIAERFAPAFALEGADGFTTGIGNFVPTATLALQDAIESEDWDRARRIRNLLRPYEELRAESGTNNDAPAANNVPAVKHGMELAGLTGGPIREPLAELSPSDQHRAEEYYEQIINGVTA